MFLELDDFALQEQSEDTLMVAISQEWYNGSYTMAAKPIKFLKLHYTMIQFSIISDMPHNREKNVSQIRCTERDCGKILTTKLRPAEVFRQLKPLSALPVLE